MRVIAFFIAFFLTATGLVHADADTWDNVLGVRLQGSAENHKLWRSVAPMWRKVMEEEAQDPLFQPGGKARLPSPYLALWNNLLAAEKKMDPLQKAKAVSGFIQTQFQGISDEIMYGMGEKWVGPAEFVRNRGGDCEDFAIVKYYALRALGYEAKNMRLLLVEVPSRKVWHALLAVLIQGKIFIFDNNFRPRDLALPHARLASYFKLNIAFNEEGAWYYQ